MDPDTFKKQFSLVQVKIARKETKFKRIAIHISTKTRACGPRAACLSLSFPNFICSYRLMVLSGPVSDQKSLKVVGNKFHIFFLSPTYL